MADTTLLNRVYDLKIAGYDDSITKVKALTEAFTKMDAVKKKLNDSLKQKTTAGDTEGIKDLTARLKELEAQMKNISVQREKSAKEAALQAKADKDLAAADAIRTKSLIDQEKELDRLIAAEDRKQKQDAKTAQGLKAQEGNYYALLQAQKAALELYRLTPSTSPLFEQVKLSATEAKAKVDAFNRSLSPDGTLVGEYKSGIINAFKQLGLSDVIKKQRDDIHNELSQLKDDSQKLASQLRTAGESGDAAFSKIDSELRLNIEHQQQLQKSLLNINSALHETGSIGSQITESLNNGFKNVKSQVAQVAAGYVGFQAVLQGVIGSIDTTKELSDQTSNLEVELGKSAGGAKNLVDQLAKLNTRTKLNVLEDIANIAAKAGVSEQNLVGVTQALDQIKIAFGKDFGDVEQGTESLVKLINIFEGSDKVTGDNLLRVGNAVRTLANESVASVPFLNDFSKRMAGLKGTFDISLPSVLGLASGFEQFGQSAEVSSTSLVRIIPKLASDTEKYAAIAGITQKAFSDLLNSNPAEALIKVSQGLVQGKGSVEEFEASFKDSSLGNGRVASIIGVLGSKADQFRASIKSAATAYGDTSNITTAFTAKNENLAASLDKISKKFADAANSTAFKVTLAAIAGVITFILGNLPLLITLGAVLAAGWVVQNSQLALLNAELFLYNTRLLIYRGIYAVLTVLNTAYSLSLGLLTGAYTLATYAATIFNTVIKASPLGLILTIVGLLGASFVALGHSINGTTASLRQKAIQDKINADIAQRVIDQTGDQIVKLANLTAVIRDNSASLDVRKKALEELHAIGGKYLEGLTLENAATAEGTKLLNDYIESLKQKAAFEAASAIQSEKIKEDLKLGLLESKLQQRVSTKKGTDLEDLSPEEKDFVGKARKNFAFTASVTDLFTGGSAADEALQVIKAQRATLAIEIDATTNIVKEKYKNLNSTVATGGGPTAAAASAGSVFDQYKQLINNKGTEEQFSNLLKDIQDQKKGTALISKEYQELDALQQKVQDILNPKKGKANSGSKLSGEQKDLFKDIDAVRDELLAKQKLLFSQLQIDEVQYLTSVLKINTDAADAKLKLIKGKNAEERKTIAELKLYKIEQEQETNKKIFEIKSKQLDRNLDDAKKPAQQAFDKVNDDPTKTNLEKLQAREKYLSSILVLQTDANAKAAQLEITYGQNSEANEKKRRDAILEINKELAKLQYDIFKESYDEQLRLQEESFTKLQNEARTNAAERTINVLSNDKLTPNQQAIQIKRIEREETKLLLAQEVADAKIALEEKEAGLRKGLATEVEVSEARKKLKLAELAVIKNSTAEELTFLQKLNNGFKDALHNLTDFFKGVKRSKEENKKDLSDAFTAAAETIKGAINDAKQAYFDNKKQQVDDEKQTTLDRLNIEQQQVENTAQSEGEKESIRAQFDEKRKAAEKKASEEKKQIALKQATIDFGLAVIKTLATYPFPFSLIPVAGLTIAYLLQRSQIQSQKFAEGGMVQPEPVGNGRIGNRPNIPIQRNGDNIYATVKTGEVILNEQQQRKAGGAAFFSKLGVPGFADGGYTGLGDFNLGDNLQPPYNSASFLLPNNNSSNGQDKINALMGMIAETNRQVNETSKQIKNIKVHVSAKEIDDTNDKRKKASAIGTI